MSTNQQFIKNILEPKEVQVGVEYALTINPDNDHQYFKESTDERIKKATTYINALLSRYPNMRCRLKMDISRNGRIHWHGIVVFKHTNHIKDFFFETIHNLQLSNQIELDTIQDMQKWIEYMGKIIWLDVEVTTETSSKKLAQALKKADAQFQKPINEY
nr:rep protein [Cressdnaviricota sp.]